MRDPLDYIYFVFGGGLTSFDWTTVIALLGFSIIYFIAPSLGYKSSGRGLILASLWVLLAKFSLSLLKLTIVFFALIEKQAGGPGGSGGSAKSKFLDEPWMMMFFFLMESGLFVLALVLFVCGLGLLRRPQDQSPSLRRDYPDE
jgi:hypothetical protein